MKNLLKKLQSAKAQIKATKLKKAGYNDYSKYYYFLPEQIEQLVYDACNDNGLFTKFDLIRNEFGESGKLTIFDIESSENVIYEMATAIPEIKATNVAQQLGGCVTYTERYLKMSAFGISENTLDFDTPQKAPITSKQNKVDVWLSEDSFNATKKLSKQLIKDCLVKYDGKTPQQDGKVYGMKKDYRTELTNLSK